MEKVILFININVVLSTWLIIIALYKIELAIRERNKK